MLIGASPILSLIVTMPPGSERFSELWILGPGHTAENYPFNVSIGIEQQVFVGVSNHLGRSAYYIVYVKFRNQTQLGPDSNTSSPSPLTPLFEFRFVLADSGRWEQRLSFSIIEASHSGDLLVVDKISIENVVFSAESFSHWDAQNSGFFYQMFFELWLFDSSSSTFKFQNRFSWLWMNVTG